MEPFDFACLPASAQAVLGRLEARGLPFWLVGGCVRDWLAGIPPKDVDLVAKGSPFSLKRLLHGELIRCRHTIVICGETQITPLGEREFSLADRDFTANAIAIDSRGRLVDPYDGVRDVQAGLFRMLSRQGLAQDPVRMLRACRLAARLGWSMEPETERAMREFAKIPSLWSGRKLKLRFGLELRKAFDDPLPSAFLSLARDYGLLKYLFPALDSLHGSKPAQAQAALAACDAAPAGAWAGRMAALLQYLNPSRPLKGANQALNFLREIKWDVIGSDFQRSSQSARAADLAVALLIAGSRLDDRAMLRQICANFHSHRSLRQLAGLAEELFGREVEAEELARAERLLRGLGRARELGRPARASALRLAGVSRRKIRSCLEEDGGGDVTPGGKADS